MPLAALAPNPLFQPYPPYFIILLPTPRIPIFSLLPTPHPIPRSPSHSSLPTPPISGNLLVDKHDRVPLFLKNLLYSCGSSSPVNLAVNKPAPPVRPPAGGREGGGREGGVHGVLPAADASEGITRLSSSLRRPEVRGLEIKRTG